MSNKMNPITRLDYPDPDVIRVNDVYYMISNTWHFMPGGVILRSYDLQHWEHVCYLFEQIEGTEKERLVGELSNYGHGMEAGRLYYHKGKFYATFFVKWYHKLFLYTADKIEGPWTAGYIEGAYYDGHLLFDEDRVYVIFGYGKLWIEELETDLSGPKTGGFGRQVLEDKEDVYVPYCTPRIYHMNNCYYIYVMQWPKKGMARRTQLVFMANSLQDEFKGSVVLCDDDGYANQGIAQGGIVDTPDGSWFSMLYQDHGAVGRLPYLVPVTFHGQVPEFGRQGKVVHKMELTSSRPFYPYEPLVCSDDFKYHENGDGRIVLQKPWQWNHVPNKEMVQFLSQGGLKIQTAKIAANLIHAQNTLTQRMLWPRSEAEVTVDATGLKDGDFAGICALQACYGLVGITKELGHFYVCVITRERKDSPMKDTTVDYLPGTLIERVEIKGPIGTLKIAADFSETKGSCEFYYKKDNNWVKIGKKHSLYFKIDHYVGCRYGLFIYATKEIGGKAIFRHFVYYDEPRL